MAQPNFLTRPLGENADVNVLPDTNPDREGRATINKLFSAINSLPIKAGGIAPKRLDINALFKLLGSDMWFNQHGGTYTYNKDYIYSLGAIIQIDSTFYVSIKENNSNNTPSTSPNFWQPIFYIDATSNGLSFNKNALKQEIKLLAKTGALNYNTAYSGAELSNVFLCAEKSGASVNYVVSTETVTGSWYYTGITSTYANVNIGLFIRIA